MNLKNCLRKEKGRIVVKAPEIKINKYWSIEMGNHWDIVTRKPTKDFYVGAKFKIKW